MIMNTKYLYVFSAITLFLIGMDYKVVVLRVCLPIL